ncbi:Cathepsin B-like isoform X1 [Aphelenchoides bicaudatus]|nr:Cathepsin B-like isoform X1 [Aphelenchoides bicaudatus]
MRALLIVFVFLLTLFSNGHGELTNQKLVDLINNSNSSFKARLNKEFGELSLQKLKHRFGGLHKKLSVTTSNKAGKPIKQHDDKEEVTHFDVSDRWPECQKTFEDVQAQGNCSAGWAFAVTETLRDRRCIKGDSRDPLSAWDLISCCDDCKFDKSNGCLGGSAVDAFEYAANGIVTGGSFYDKQGCKPYPLDPKSSIQTSSTTCYRECRSSYNKNYYDDRVFVGSYTFLDTKSSIMDALLSRGPVVAKIEMYADFLFYNSGVYSHEFGDYIGIHHVKITGWGVTNDGVKYWSGINSFGGNSWGENGAFKFLRGTNECGIEANVIEGLTSDPHQNPTPKPRPTACPTKHPVKITTTKSNPPPVRKTTKVANNTFSARLLPTPTTGSVSCQNLIAYYKGTFQNSYSPNLNYFAEFQLRLSAADQSINARLDKWNSNYQNSDDFGLEFCYGTCIGCNNVTAGCSGAFAQWPEQFWLNFDHGKPWNWTNLFRLLYFSSFDNTFTLDNAVGQCTKRQVQFYDEYTPYSTEYSYCACCGDTYNPHPSLECPSNPWA